MSFGLSAGIHGAILAWLALSPPPAPQPRRSLYQMEVKPHETHIVWYNLRERLPNVTPAHNSLDTRPPRALRKFDQNLAAGAKDNARAPQMIFMPAPEIQMPKPLPLPNVLAVAPPPRPLRTFTPPAEKPAASAPPVLPDAPRVTPVVETRSLPLATPPVRPLKKFTPPPAVRREPAKVTIPEAPRVNAAVKDEKLPLDFANPRVQPRAFTPPPAAPVPSAPVILADAPAIAAPPPARSRPLPVPDPRAPLRRFNPPKAAAPVPDAPVVLPEAPGVATRNEARSLPLPVPDPRAPLRRFNPPKAAAPVPDAPLVLPEAPGVATLNEPRNLPLPVPDPRAPLRRFSPPKAAAPVPDAPLVLPEAPGVATRNEARSLPLPVPDPRAPLRRFTPPPAGQPASSTELPAAPAVDGLATSKPAEATLAIVGLNPSKAPDFPTPPGSRQAGFSGGPQSRKQGGDGAAEDGAIVVPWLTARGGAKDAQPTLAVNPDPMARENLLAAARNALRNPPADPAMPAATRVLSAPDPRLEGRAVYSIAIQMPNVTSYSGSWIVWFAERTPVPGAPPPEVRAPVPLRKVDPKYVAEAVQERVEGSVRLFAVIRQDGHVESVHLLKHLDLRLDRSAEEALAKWVFEPALRNGAPMDVEAVFEIPFHLAPRPAR